MSRAEYVPVVPRVTADEATELMIHHLQMAYSYFEISPASPSTRMELQRHMQRATTDGSPMMVAVRAFFDVATAEHERLAQNQGQRRG